MNLIIPAPKLYQENEKTFSSDYPLKIDLDFQSVFPFYCDYLSYDAENAIVHCEIDARLLDDLSSEGYDLNVWEDEILIRAGTEQGIFYGIQSLMQMLPLDEDSGSFTLPQCTINDVPAYGWRGFMFDEARHFFGKETVKKILDWMAAYKLNRFHWHLTDDQGWRVEIKAYPELTKIGSTRKRTKLGSFIGLFKRRYFEEVHEGFYTQDDIREIVRYAKERHIDVIPEFDIPGHFSAVLAAYPEFGCTGETVQVKEGSGIFKDVACVGNDATMIFLKTVIDELCDLFPYPYMHIGGDEVKTENWKKCPKCLGLMKKEAIQSFHELQVYFTNEIAAHLRDKGRTALVWNEAVHPDLAEDVMLIHWIPFGKHTRNTLNAIHAGRKTLMQPIFTTYFDYSYALVPMRKINQYNERKGIQATGLDNLVGVQCALWTEYISDEAHVQFNCFPKMALMAEAGWGTRVDDDASDFLRRWAKGEMQQRMMGLDYAAPLEAVNPRWFKRWETVFRCMFIDMRYEMKQWL